MKMTEEKVSKKEGIFSRMKNSIQSKWDRIKSKKASRKNQENMSEKSLNSQDKQIENSINKSDNVINNEEDSFIFKIPDDIFNASNDV